jgi:hypothetical protein
MSNNAPDFPYRLLGAPHPTPAGVDDADWDDCFYLAESRLGYNLPPDKTMMAYRRQCRESGEVRELALEILQDRVECGNVAVVEEQYVPSERGLGG